MANFLKKTISSLLEQMLIPSTVTGIRAWQPATMYEIDIHLPLMDMGKWSSIRRLKCRVDELKYNDYTPAIWNSEKRICTMFIGARHHGAGSRWIQKLKIGDEILLGAAHAARLPAKEGRILCLGDESSLGHFLALKQLTDRTKYPLEVVIHLQDHYQIPVSLTDNHPEFQFITATKKSSLVTLEHLCISKDLSNYTSIYIAGNIPMVTGLRKRLKAMPDVHATICCHGFWS